MEEVTGLEELRTLCYRPDIVADLRHIISRYSAVTGRYEICGLADYLGERGVETS